MMNEFYSSAFLSETEALVELFAEIHAEGDKMAKILTVDGRKYRPHDYFGHSFPDRIRHLLPAGTTFACKTMNGNNEWDVNYYYDPNMDFPGADEWFTWSGTNWMSPKDYVKEKKLKVAKPDPATYNYKLHTKKAYPKTYKNKMKYDDVWVDPDPEDIPHTPGLPVKYGNIEWKYKCRCEVCRGWNYWHDNEFPLLLRNKLDGIACVHCGRPEPWDEWVRRIIAKQ